MDAGFPGVSLCRAGRKRSPCRVMLHGLGVAQTDDVEYSWKPIRPGSLALSPLCSVVRRLSPCMATTASEALVVDLDHPTAPPRLIAPRRPGSHYDVMDHGDRSLSAQCGYADFKIVIAPRDAPQEANWRDSSPSAMDASSPSNALQAVTSCCSCADQPPAFRRPRPGKRGSDEIAFDEETISSDARRSTSSTRPSSASAIRRRPRRKRLTTMMSSARAERSSAAGDAAGLRS